MRYCCHTLMGLACLGLLGGCRAPGKKPNGPMPRHGGSPTDGRGVSAVAPVYPDADPDNPAVWVQRLEAAKDLLERERAVVNLYRIYEIRKAQAERDPRARSAVEAFRRLVTPALVRQFHRKIGGRYVQPDLEPL